MTIMRRAGWAHLLAGCFVLALPTAIAPGSGPAGVTYLLGSAWITGALYLATRRAPRGRRLPWLLLAATATLWVLGDTLERLLDVIGRAPGAISLPDVLWLSSYPLQIAAINAVIRTKGLSLGTSRDILLDVIIVATAAGLGAWHLLIAPGLGTDPSTATTAVNVAYSLGDVVVFGLALTVLLIPGSWGPTTLLLVGCLGATLPLDCLIQYVADQAPGFDAGRLDAAFLVVNSLLGAAALHPSRDRLTEPALDGPGRHLEVWRVGALGLSLLGVSATNALGRSAGLHRLPDLVGTLVISLTIIVRFYRAARAQERTAAALRNLVDHDQLTGAANRSLLARRLPGFVSAGSGLLIFIDLDGFKSINDTYGHPAGDALLRVVTERLQAATRETDTVARIGGDEFVVLLHGPGPDEAPAVARRILEDLCRPVSVGPAVMRVGASIGVVVLDPRTDHDVTTFVGGPAEQDAAMTEDLLQWGDSAMYDVKRRGGGIRVVEYGTLPEPQRSA